MKQNGYEWWIERLKFNLNLYDIVRIDHFRGFAGYYTVPYGDKTARNGKWKKGKGKEIFTEIKNKVKDVKVIAEDLGYIDKPVEDLIDFCGFPGMKVLQFAFTDDGDKYLPRNFVNSNCVVYTGTHDSDCSLSWIKRMSKTTKKKFINETKMFINKSDVERFIKLAMNSIADYAIIPLQDYIELSNREGRVNIPSTSTGNWQWILDDKAINNKLIRKIKTITESSGRG